MSETLLHKLKLLEQDYFHQPLIAQQLDLKEINQIRSQLGLSLVDAHLNEIVKTKPIPIKETIITKIKQDHTEARAIYQAYLNKIASLKIHQAYAQKVSNATKHRGKTPVCPLATMGSNGGPLLCDYCKKPIVLEGGKYNGVTADIAWQENPQQDWVSFILGGMVVEIETNGTLRIYHGYPGQNDRYCCNLAYQQNEKAWAEHNSNKATEKSAILLAFIQQELSDIPKEKQSDLLNDILDVMYGYDPGIGINQP